MDRPSLANKCTFGGISMGRVTGRKEAARPPRTADRERWRARLQVEELETRLAPAVLTPVQIRHAYGFDQINFTVNGQTIRGDGAGQTIAIVNAYGNTRIVNDLDVFDRSF